MGEFVTLAEHERIDEGRLVSTLSALEGVRFQELGRVKQNVSCAPSTWVARDPDQGWQGANMKHGRSLAVVGCLLVASACSSPHAAADAPITSDGISMGCEALPKSCGPALQSSCCTTALVPGGTFFRHYDSVGDLFSDMSNPATISDFNLDMYDVTVGRFRQFVEAGLGTQASPPASGAGAHAQIANSGWNPAWNSRLVADTTALVAGLDCDAAQQSWTDAPGDNEELPINCVSWVEAFAFCAWDGGYLPTDAEVNYAAAGGAEQRAYPWSVPPNQVTISCSTANFKPINYCTDPPTGRPNRVGFESPSGDGKWGHADLGGNVWEWTLDTLEVPFINPCNDCAQLSDTGSRIIHGGAFDAPSASLRSANISAGPDSGSDLRAPNVGVRCARSP